MPHHLTRSHADESTIGTPGTADAVRLVLLGSGELGREVAIEAMRLGCEVVAVDRYAGRARDAGRPPLQSWST